MLCSTCPKRETCKNICKKLEKLLEPEIKPSFQELQYDNIENLSSENVMDFTEPRTKQTVLELAETMSVNEIKYHVPVSDKQIYKIIKKDGKLISKKEQIVKLLKKNVPISDITLIAKCTKSYIYTIKRGLKKCNISPSKK